MRKSTNVQWGIAGHSNESQLQQRQQAPQPKVEFKNEHSAFAEQSTVNLQRLLENIPGVVIEYESRHDGTHHYRYISKAIENVFGVEASHIFKITQYIHPDDLDKLNKALDRSAKTLEPFYNESRLIVPGRGIIWRSMSCCYSHTASNGAKIFSGIILDISERKKADARINESESRLSSLIGNFQTGVLLDDGAQNVTLTNEMFCDIFNIDQDPEDLKGKDSMLIAEQIKHQFKDPDYFSESLLTIIEFQKPALNDIFELKDGRILRREYIPIYADKIFKGNLWKYTDVTTDKNAESTLRIREEKYRSIIDNMNLGLLEVDTEEKILFANQCFCDMCGYELDELLGKRAAQIFTKGENIELMERKNEERRRSGTSDAYEIVIKDKRGRVRWWLVSGAPRYNDKGDLVGSIGIHLDITDQKQLEVELTGAREQAEQSTRSKEVFLANMSHEIRTPMNAILGMSNQLSKTPLNKKQLFYLDTINSASENLLVIINDILDLSKIEAGKLSLEKIAFEPKEVIKRAIQVLIHKAEEKGLALGNSYFDDRVSPVLMGDPYRLNQVMLNIITNAIKFTEKGSVDIQLFVVKNTKTSQTIKVDIRDTGIGMDESFKNSLFEKFSQEEASITRQYGGTGLGMSICKELIELMEGEVLVESEKGVGTCISFVVNFSKGAAEDLPSKEEFVADESMLSGKKILVVDDNEINRLVATTILNNYGAETVEAANGAESVEYLKQHMVDLVLMDIQMPVMNGYDAARKIREEISDKLPVIALTANAIKGDNKKCIEAGMNDYIAKPFKEEDLLKMMAGILQTNVSIKTKKPAAMPKTEEIAYYDITEISKISRGNETFVQKMLKMFVDQVPKHMEEMKEKYAAKELISVGEIAHRIKPTIDNMGIVASKNTIREIEKIGKSGIDTGTLQELITKVEKDISLAVEAIKKDFQLS
jgi:two-component system, sensor histidine kinase